MIAATKNKATGQPRAMAYARVSTDRQAKSGLGLAGQDVDSREYFDRVLKPAGVEWVGVFEDKAVSAFKRPFRARPAAIELMRDLRPGDHIIIPKMDRAFRSTKDFLVNLEEWMAKGVYVHVIDVGMDTTLPDKAALVKLYATIRAAFAEFESRIKAQRQIDVNIIRRIEGRSLGKAPVGFRNQKVGNRVKLVPNKEERAVMKQIFQLREKGWGFRRIASFLAEQDVMYKIKDKTRREGYRLEYWSYGRCERAYHNIIAIMADELKVKQAGGASTEAQPTDHAELREPSG